MGPSVVMPGAVPAQMSQKAVSFLQVLGQGCVSEKVRSRSG